MRNSLPRDPPGGTYCLGWAGRIGGCSSLRSSTSAEVGATRSRTAKLAALTELLRRLAPEEVVPAVAALTGAPRQGRIGVGWRTVYGVEVAPAQDPCLELLELDATLARKSVV